MSEVQEAPLVVFSGGHSRALCFNPDASRLFVTLDHFRVGRTGFSDHEPSRFMRRHGMAQLQLHSAGNDWYLNPDLGEMRAALEAFCGRFDEVRTMSFSMGGYGALLFSRQLRLRKALLFGPHYSILAGRAPYETRYRKEAAGLNPALDGMERDLAPGVEGVILFDPRLAMDREHARRIAAIGPGLRAVALPFAGHPGGRAILGSGLFGELRKIAAFGDVTAAEMRGLHRKARETDEQYLKGVAKWMRRRGSWPVF